MISIDNTAISAKAASGSTVGTLTMTDSGGVARKSNWILTEGAAGFFAISGAALVTLRAAIPPGFYSVKICGNAQFVPLSDDAAFIITVTPT
jgi:hypothetical protein